jgi:hypothetical protein
MKTQTLKLIDKWLREKIARQSGPDHSVDQREEEGLGLVSHGRSDPGKNRD